MRYCRLPLLAALAAVLLSSAQYSGSGRNKVFKQVNLVQVMLFPLPLTLQCELGLVTWGASIILPANTTSYTDPASSFSGSGTYKYQVRAGNTNGNSVWIGAQVSVQ